MSERPPTGFDRAAQASELWVIRHAESTWNAGGLYQGQSDVPLSAAGERQAEALARRLSGQRFDAAYSSDLERAQHTAELVSARLNPPLSVTSEAGLREIHVGELTGLSLTQITQRYPAYLSELRQDPWGTRRPGGESMADLYARAAITLQEIAARHPGKRVLVFTHGGVVRVAVGLALGGAPQQAWARLSVANTSITRVLLGDEHSTLLTFNDAAHLEALPPSSPQAELINRGIF